MKEITLFIFVLIILSAQEGWAHPPTDISLKYDKTKKMVTATIIHPVKDVTTHYLKKVDLSVNGKEVMTKKFTRQENSVSQSVSFQLTDIRSGDEIGVEGYCNLSGKLERELKVE